MGTCPPGCVIHETELVVDAVSGDLKHTVSLPAVTRSGPPRMAKPAPTPAAAASPAPSDRAAPATGGLTRFVTVGQFARFLQANPSSQPDAARASNWADAGYLKGWDGAQPPPDASSGAPIDAVSPIVARNYCRSRGASLPSVDDPIPGGGSTNEIRMAGTGYRMLLGEGVAAPMKGQQAITGTRFRCTQ